MGQILTTLGSLTSHVLQVAPERTPPELAMVLCHGFGAPGDDLVPLGVELAARDPEMRRVRFVFPQAPISLGQLGFGDARAWWPLDVERLVTAQTEGSLRSLQEEVPPGLPQARRLLMALIDQLTQQTRLPISRVVVGGFSQGAMLATEVALRLEEAPAGLVIFSGTLLCQKEWRKRAPLRKGLPVLQTHGRQDPLLPFSAAEALRDLLQEAGLQVEFLPFDGVHTIPAEGLERLARLLRGLLR